MPFASRDLPIARGWGTGGLHVTLALVEPRDVTALTTAIERFLTDPAFYSRARQNTLARFREQYASTAVAASYSLFYEAAMGQ